MKQLDSNGIGKNIDEFQKVFEDLDVKTASIDDALDNVY